MSSRKLHIMVPEDHALRFLVGVALLNSLICIVAPALIVFEVGEEVWAPIFWLAVAALALTPIQLVVLWLVLRGRIHALIRRQQIKHRIHGILNDGGLQIAFQPIRDLTSGGIHGLEALSRFPDQQTRTPDVWFAEAHEVGCGLEMELLAVRLALDSAARLPGDHYIAVNVSPATLQHPDLLKTAIASGFPASRLVVEVTEHDQIADYTSVCQTTERLRVQGIRIAVDDAGAGYSSMRHIVALAPDIIKVDRGLVTGIDTDKARRALVASIVLFALDSGAVVVGEGVETAEELEALGQLGVDAAQGYFLQPPSTSSELWREWTEAVPNTIVTKDVLPGPRQRLSTRVSLG
jgi:EAL domain-containing protein (putative c-di-GMP-specific phosphodiesterase class I)